MPRTVVLVDATNLAYRAYHVNKHLQTSSGRPTGVVYGFLRMAQDIQSKVGDCDAVFCWEGTALASKNGDPFQKSWRKVLQPKVYKANRQVTDHTLHVRKQIPKVHKVLSILQYPQFCVPGLEADDVIGVLSRYLANSKRTDKVFILSGDRDFFQCISGKIKVLRPEKGRLKTYDAAAVFKEFKVSPEDWAAYRALCGDSVDNYDGVPGIGPVKAAALISLGVDPSKEWAHQDKAVRREASFLQEHWNEAMKCWILSFMPGDPEYPLFPAKSRKLLLEQMDVIKDKCRRVLKLEDYKKALQAFTAFCAEYEFLSIIAERRRYFSSVKILT